MPGNYYDILNLSTSATHGIQIASHYGAAASTAVYIRTRSDNGSAPSGAGLQPWALIWTARTDGAGSGLDADLLDGQHGSYFTQQAILLDIYQQKHYLLQILLRSQVLNISNLQEVQLHPSVEAEVLLYRHMHLIMVLLLIWLSIEVHNMLLTGA